MAADLPTMKVWAQRGSGDCAIACLAMLLDITYEDALEVMTFVAPGAHRKGVWRTQIVAAAAKLGVALVKRQPIAYEHATGILDCVISDGRKRVGHVVVLRWGLIFDPDGGTVWEPETYIATKRADVRGLLTREG